MALLRRAGAGVLLLFALGSVSLSAQERRVGRVVQAAPRVTGRLAGQSTDLKQRPEVFLGMEVETALKAGARIAINPDLKRQGMVVLGPGTTVAFTEHLVSQTLGLAKMSWLVKLGQFRLALLPPPPGAPLEEGEYTIITPDQTVVRLRGTDVAVQVDRWGTLTVWVIEGEVTVETPESGGPVRVAAGYRSRVRRHGRPERPVRFVEADGPAPPLSWHPGETIFPDPPGLDLRRLRLDLPQ